ncbi:AAA domain-containing protein [Chitinophaga sp. SYP-B3965]|uniref:AAA family ATPase n=1 Tax=Chitinophaga sp. SYP-B3965 TaxID=2663120 RepID=UPI00129994DB|nr:MoxR family ATPase [Chitinophaga sp. SYP-B3965]MRG46720.1 AAA domain-containing protein [Chitinophaga sp. SYP-B3965]
MEEEAVNTFEPRTDLSAVHAAIAAVKAEIAKVIVGQHQMIDLLTAGLLANGHILIEGVPGVAKTLAAKLLASTIDAKFSRIQFTPDLMPADVLGTSIFNPQSKEFEYKKGPIFGNIILIDEINRAPAKTQAALFEVMEERQITNDGISHFLNQPFMVIATQNPIEQEGTYRLPEAQLDRFLFKIEVKYPQVEEEIEILKAANLQLSAHILDKVEKVLTATQVQDLQAKVRGVLLDEKLLQYIATLVNETRHNPSIYLGASPRASIAVMNCAKAIAVMNGRDFVTPDDIVFVLPHILRHRIMLTPEREMEGITPDDIIAEILKAVAVPR